MKKIKLFLDFLKNLTKVINIENNTISENMENTKQIPFLTNSRDEFEVEYKQFVTLVDAVSTHIPSATNEILLDYLKLLQGRLTGLKSEIKQQIKQNAKHSKSQNT